MPPATDDVGPFFVTATSFCCVRVVVTDAELFVVGVSVVAVSVVLITALFTRAAVELGRIAATMMIVLLLLIAVAGGGGAGAAGPLRKGCAG